MKKTALCILMSTLISGSFAAQLETDEQKIAYAIGKQVGDSLETVSSNIKIDEKVLFEAITDSLQKKPSQLDDKQMNDAMSSLQSIMQKSIQAKAKVEADKNRAESQKFLDENKKKDGVKVTKSGLQYRVIKTGEGEMPQEKDVVKVHYKGSLINGTVFDSSAKSGKPIEFPLSGVIAGWTEGLQLMPKGSKFEFFIPAELAYGDSAPPSIGPGQALIFEVELLEIKASKEKPAQEKPAQEKPAQEKPAQEKPAQEKPAQEKPAQEKPAQ